MHCPFCSNDNTRVLESRSTDDSTSIRRRRECLNCTNRFTTYERIEAAPLVVIKNGGSREVYAREKLVKSIVRSCSKSQMPTMMIDSIVDQVEIAMRQNNRREISSDYLGRIVLDHLKKSDALAYVRYASIFKKFSSVEEFLYELKELEDEELGIKFEKLDLDLEKDPV